jgi:putative chitinase
LLDTLASLFGDLAQASAAATSTAPETTATVVATVDMLQAAGVPAPQASAYLDTLNAAMAEFDIVTELRVTMFIAQVAWESSHFTRFKELGGFDGDEWQGYGAIQLTGQYNQLQCAQFFGLPQDRAAIQAWLQTPAGAFRSAGWFWMKHGCNELADANDFVGVTRKINGGTNGLPGRMAIWQAINSHIGVA